MGLLTTFRSLNFILNEMDNFSQWQMNFKDTHILKVPLNKEKISLHQER